MPDTSAPATPRLVPGAPLPTSLSTIKSQKKKRTKGPKTKEESDEGSHVAVPDSASAALIDKAPDESDLKEGLVAPQLIAQASEDGHIQATDNKSTPIVEMLNKRLKANGKKIARINNYQNEPPEKLNDDQRRLLKQLPILEAVSKELEEVKKAIETHEAEVAQGLASLRAEAAQAEEERIREAVADAKTRHLRKAADLVTFLRLHSLLSNRHPDALALNLDETESVTIYSIAEVLFHEAVDGKEDLIRSIWTGDGEFNGVPFSRIAEIQDQFLHPIPSTHTQQVEVAEEATPVEALPPSVSGVPPAASASGAIHFIMTDELAEVETDVAAENATGSGEWVDVTGAEPEQTTEGETMDTVTIAKSEVNGHAGVEEPVTTTTELAPSSQLNWADEDHGDLPSLANLQAHYGTPGEAPFAPEPETAHSETPSTPQPNGHSRPIDDDGFTHHHRGRGRGRGGFRGSERGGERSGFREHRGEYRSEHRSEHRGGERGGRGGFRGGDRGGFRGKPSDGDWRGGRGRGRGRGGFQDAPSRGGPPPTA